MENNEMVENNILLVKSIANHYINMGLEFDDLVQEGCIGLLEASKRFDTNKNCEFSTYAVWWIKKYIIMALKTKRRIIRYPKNVEEELKKIVNAQTELNILGIEPTIDELSKKTGFSNIIIKNRLNDLKEVYSLNRKNSQCEDFEIGDLIYNKNNSLVEIYELSNMKNIIYKIIEESNFTYDEKRILIMHYGLNENDRKSLASIGRIKNVSRKRMSQINEDILLRLRLHKDIEELKIYLDSPDKSFSNLIDLVNKEKVIESTKRKISNLYNCFRLFDKKIINKVISLLDTYQQDIIYKCYDRELNMKSDDNFYLNKFIYNVLPKLENYIYLVSMRIDDNIIKENNCKTIVHKKNSYYSYFNGFEKEFIDVATNNLNDEQKSFLNSFYVNGLDNINSRPFNEDEYNYFMNKLIYPIRRKVKIICNDFYLRTSYLNIYELFNQYSKKVIDLVLDCLTKDEKELLLCIWSNKLSKEKLLYITSELIPKINVLLKRKFKSLYITGKNKSNLFSIISEYTENEVMYALESLSLSEYELLINICGKELDKNLTSLNNNDKILLFEQLIPKIYKILEYEYSLENNIYKKLDLKNSIMN